MLSAINYVENVLFSTYVALLVSIIYYLPRSFPLLSIQALLHACTACSLKPAVDWIAASDLEDESAKLVVGV